MIKEIHEVFVVINERTAEVEGVYETYPKAMRFKEANTKAEDLSIVKRRVR